MIVVFRWVVSAVPDRRLSGGFVLLHAGFSHSVSTRVGRVLIIALRCVLARRDVARSDRQPLNSNIPAWNYSTDI